MPMERSRRKFYFWILITTLTLAHWVVECDKLEGYSFPVYNTTSCPSNQSEWRNRSSDLNCTESNGYTCIPNENITQLLEFCYRYPRIPIEKNICLILKKSTSLVEAYSCKKFRNGCPDKQYWSNEVFDYPSCLSIGHRCFLDEPFCKDERIATTTLGSTPIPDINENNSWVWILVIGLFLLIVFILVFALIIIFRRGNQKTLDDGHEEEETILLKMDISGEREIFNREEISLVEYEDEMMESEANKDLDAESLLVPLKTRALDKDHRFGDNSTNEISLMEYTSKNELKETEGNQELDDESLLLPANRKTLDEENNSEDESLNKTDIEKTEEEGGKRKSDEEFLKNDKAKIHSNTPHLHETNMTASEVNSEINYFSLDEDVREGISSDSNHLKDSDRTISKELSKVGIHLDDYEVWKTEMSELFKKLSNEERAVLYLLLCSSKNTFILEKTETLTKQLSKIMKTLDVSKNISESIQAMQSKGLVSIENEKVTFASDDVHDETMFDYVHTCWKRIKVDVPKMVISNKLFEDKNFKMFNVYGCMMKKQLLKVSVESLLKYFRSKNYRKGKFVRCLGKDNIEPSIYDPIPLEIETSSPEILTKIISGLGIDVLINDLVDEKQFHSIISNQLKIPEEVLLWDLEARSRYLQYLKKGKTPIHRARGMLVGCAGAGKTTLLERLQKTSLEDIQKIKSTVGLDVHNDIFEVQEKEGKLQG